MYKIVICDDETIFLNHIRKCLLQEAQNLLKEPPEIEVFSSGSELLNHLENVADLYILDILLPGKSGMEIASIIRELYPQACIIFVSSKTDAVFESIHYMPFRFVRKENLNAELHEAFEAFLEKEQTNSSLFSIHTTSGEHMLRYASLRFVETEGHYLYFHHGTQTYKVRGRLSDYSNQFQLHAILPISQSYAVNLRFVLEYENHEVVLTDGKRLVVSRRYRENFRNDFLIYQRRQHHANIL